MNRFQRKLLETGLEEGHFIFASGRHSDVKFEFDNIAAHRYQRMKVAKGLSVLVHDTFPECDTVVTVGNGANILAKPVSRNLGSLSGKEVMPLETSYVKAEHGKKFYVVHGNVHARDRKVAIVDDAFTRGTNTTKVGNLLQQFDAEVLGVAVVLNRNTESIDSITLENGQNVQVASLLEYPMADWPKEACNNASCN